ncbi:MAG: magnesium and cobalt exporter, family, partial [Actinomycetota bacterium]|nr:magnesium and cobalt exporter, family [Actinomycetota bacterium]
MTVWYLLIAIVLLIANGFFVAAQFALVTAPRTKIEQAATSGSLAGRMALSSVREVSFMLAGTQLGITMASLGLGFVAEPAIARLFEIAFGSTSVPESVAHSISIALGLGIVVFLHMVIGEMAPKNLTIAGPERAALWIAIPFRVYANIFRPFIRLLSGIASAALRLFGVEVKQEVSMAHSASEIGFLIAASAKEGMLDQFEQRLLSGAVEFGNKDAAAVMIPRTEMLAIPSTTSVAEVE